MENTSSSLADSVIPAQDSRALYSAPTAVAHDQMPWYGVHVKSNSERAVAAFMEAKGYQPFLPTYRARRRWSDRVKELELPLFPGYVFCRIDVNNRLPVLMAPGVVGIVGFGKTPAPIADQEIEAIQTIVASGLGAQPWSAIQSGAQIRIIYGPLRGVEGCVVNVNNDERLVVSITLLQRAVSVKLDRTWVRVVN